MTMTDYARLDVEVTATHPWRFAFHGVGSYQGDGDPAPTWFGYDGTMLAPSEFPSVHVDQPRDGSKPRVTELRVYVGPRVDDFRPALAIASVDIGALAEAAAVAVERSEATGLA